MSRPGTAGDLLLWMPGAVRVQVIGDWNEWGGVTGAGSIPDPSTGVMVSEDGSSWAADVPGELPVGWYRYAFLVDGWRWVADPLNPETTLFMEHEVSVMRVRN
jgi:1,4-alpha-glucan branching enzyme